MSADIIFETEAPVARITIDRPGDLNRLTPASLDRLGEIIGEIEADDGVHAVVITGGGDGFFSAGLLNPDIRAAMDKDEVVAFVLRANRVLDAIEALPQIVIAAINGDIMAGAVELALACDIRLASAATRLSMPEAKWGGFPGAGGPVRLPQAVGYAKALELICTGREIDAAEMERIGLVQSVHPAGRVKQAAFDLAIEIGNNGPLATRGAKRIMRARLDPGFRPARALSDELRAALEYSHDVDEGLAAHKENRAPKFTGR